MSISAGLADGLRKFKDLSEEDKEAFFDLLSEYVEEAENNPLNKEFEIVIPICGTGEAADATTEDRLAEASG